MTTDYSSQTNYFSDFKNGFFDCIYLSSHYPIARIDASAYPNSKNYYEDNPRKCLVSYTDEDVQLMKVVSEDRRVGHTKTGKLVADKLPVVKVVMDLSGVRPKEQPQRFFEYKAYYVKTKMGLIG